jgi:hypothetical protein
MPTGCAASWVCRARLSTRSSISITTGAGSAIRWCRSTLIAMLAISSCLGKERENRRPASSEALIFCQVWVHVFWRGQRYGNQLRGHRGAFASAMFRLWRSARGSMTAQLGSGPAEHLAEQNVSARRDKFGPTERSAIMASSAKLKHDTRARRAFSRTTPPAPGGTR